MHPFLEPCLLGAIQYLIFQIRVSTPEQAYFEILLSLLEILLSLLETSSPKHQEDDIFSSNVLEPKTSRVLQILAPDIFAMTSSLSIPHLKPYLDTVNEILDSYFVGFRPSLPQSRKEIIVVLRMGMSRLAQWAASWNQGTLVPQGVDINAIGVAVRMCGPSVVIRHIVAEMWAMDESLPFHSGISTRAVSCG
jgi:hypothetical protein